VSDVNNSKEKTRSEKQLFIQDNYVNDKSVKNQQTFSAGTIGGNPYSIENKSVLQEGDATDSTISPKNDLFEKNPWCFNIRKESDNGS
jgi:hypothetical protein